MLPRIFAECNNLFRQEMPFHVGSASQHQAARSGALSGTHLGSILPHTYQIEAMMYLHRSKLFYYLPSRIR